MFFYQNRFVIAVIFPGSEFRNDFPRWRYETLKKHGYPALFRVFGLSDHFGHCFEVISRTRRELCTISVREVFSWLMRIVWTNKIPKHFGWFRREDRTKVPFLTMKLPLDRRTYLSIVLCTIVALLRAHPMVGFVFHIYFCSPRATPSNSTAKKHVCIRTAP